MLDSPLVTDIVGGEGASLPEEDREPPRIPPSVLTAPRQHPKVLTQESQAALRQLRRRSRASGALSPLTYNLTISHTHRFIWFRNAKVGTRTVLNFLDEHHGEEGLLVLSRVPYPTAAFRDYFKFGFVRDPLDRFISAWQDKVHQQNHFHFAPDEWERMKTIEHFAAWVAEQDLRDLTQTDRHIALQSRLVDLSQVDFLGRIETFAADFSEVCRRIGVEWQEPERRNQSEPRGVTRDNASDELRSIVEEKYRRDYQVFGY